MAGQGLSTYQNLNTTAIGGISLTGSQLTINGNLISTGNGPCAITHTGLLILEAGASSLLTGAFTESGMGGTVNLSGTLHASNANVSFANPITLIGPTTLNSNDGGDLLIGSTIDGPYDLVYTVGTGNLTLAAAIGGTTPVSSLTITTANNASAQTIRAGSIVQASGSGTSTFHGPLTTNIASWYLINGNRLCLRSYRDDAKWRIGLDQQYGTALYAGWCSLQLRWTFYTNGTGPVSLCADITTTGDAIAFASAVTLCGGVSLDSGVGAGTISFGNTVQGGSNPLTLNAGVGNVTFSGNVTGVSDLQILSCAIFTSQSISATQIELEGVSGLATVNGTLTTSGSSGITFSGFGFTLLGNVTTTGGGPLTVANTSTLTLQPNVILSLTGPFMQTGLGGCKSGWLIEHRWEPNRFCRACHTHRYSYTEFKRRRYHIGERFKWPLCRIGLSGSWECLVL